MQRISLFHDLNLNNDDKTLMRKPEIRFYSLGYITSTNIQLIARGRCDSDLKNM